MKSLHGAVWWILAVGLCAVASEEVAGDARAFWSFRPVVERQPPDVRHRSWPTSSIDRFILAKLEAAGLQPVRPADRRVLLRRAYIDLWGLLPSADDANSFVRDRSPDAFAKVVERLLASPRYGERWGRYWLDVARYADDRLDGTPYENAFRYRDWVIDAFNADMPYDRFVKAQIAGDLIDATNVERLMPGLGFYALANPGQDDRVDVTTRGFLGLTVACARCHDHKFDPIPQTDFYALQGVFRSTQPFDYPIGGQASARAWDEQKADVDRRRTELKQFVAEQSARIAAGLAARTADYLMAADRALATQPSDLPAIADDAGLDRETLQRWLAYLRRPVTDHPYLNDWRRLRLAAAGPRDLSRASRDFAAVVLAVAAEEQSIEERNRVTSRGSTDRGVLSRAALLSLDRDNYYLWSDLFGDRGIYSYNDRVARFLTGEPKRRLEALRGDLAQHEQALPPKYPSIHGIRDVAAPGNARVEIRGNPANLGAEVPRHFVTVLSDGAPAPFVRGSGRLELAEAIASPANPLTARVIANRIWQLHFGQGLVRTPSNFGHSGDPPSHPELLDYLAARLVAGGWSIKQLHREIMLSAVYAESGEDVARARAVDPENRLLWRANRRRLDAEALRDTLLQVAGTIELDGGGPPRRLTDDFRRRAVYGFVSRKALDPMLALFDFPNPNTSSETRVATTVPLQRIYLMNSTFVRAVSHAIANRIDGSSEHTRIDAAYRLLFQRSPTSVERRLGVEFLRASRAADEYAQALVSSNEFLFID